MSEGILYIANGENYVEEAKISAERINEVMPDVSISLITDQDIECDYFDNIFVEELKDNANNKFII